MEKVYLKEDNGNITTSSSSGKHNAKSTTSSSSSAHNAANNINNNHKEILDFNTTQQTSHNKGHSNGNFIEVCDEYGYKVSLY